MSPPTLPPPRGGHIPPPPDLPPRQVARIVFNGVTVVSLLLCVVFILGWQDWHLSGGSGFYSADPAAKSHPINFRYLFLELIHDTSKAHRPVVFWILIVPPWWQAAMFGLLPTVWTLAWLGKRCRNWFSPAPAPGHCPECGYDLRGTPQHCPECGWLAERATISSP